MAFTADANAHEQELRGLISDPDHLVTITVAHTKAALDAVAADISRRVNEPVAGASISAVGTRENLSRVSVMLDVVTEEARRELSEHYGAEIICLEHGRIQALPG